MHVAHPAATQRGSLAGIASLDFQKPYDRLDRQWVLKCMQVLGVWDLSSQMGVPAAYTAHSQDSMAGTLLASL